MCQIRSQNCPSRLPGLQSLLIGGEMKSRGFVQQTFIECLGGAGLSVRPWGSEVSNVLQVSGAHCLVGRQMCGHGCKQVPEKVTIGD